MNHAVADVLKPPGTRSSRDRSRHRSSACHKLPLRAAPPGCARFRAPRRHATRASSTGFEAPSRCAWRTRQRSGMPSRFGQHTRSTPADRGQWAGMPCHAPLNHSGGNRLGCVTLHPCCRVRARRTGRYRRGARKTEPAKPVLPCQGPFCFTGHAPLGAAARLHHRKFGLCPRDALRTSTLAYATHCPMRCRRSSAKRSCAVQKL